MIEVNAETVAAALVGAPIPGQTIYRLATHTDFGCEAEDCCRVGIYRCTADECGSVEAAPYVDAASPVVNGRVYYGGVAFCPEHAP